MTQLTLDLNNPAIRANPYPLYKTLRRDAPVVRARLPMIGPVWLVTRYHDVLTVLKDPRFANDAANAGGTVVSNKWYIPRIFRLLQDSMVMKDDAEHRRLRNLVHLAFTPRMLAQLEGRVAALVDELLDGMAVRPKTDLIADFALPLPLRVISDMLGVPEADRFQFHHWSAQFLENINVNPLRLLWQLPTAWRMTAFLEKLIRLRRDDPQDDLLTALVSAESAGDRLDGDDLMAMIFLLLLAGHETTVNLIGNGVLALLDAPDQMALLQAQPELIDSAIEEMLRFTNPVESPSPRYVREDLVLAGQPLARGDVVLPALASANYDETVFAEPERFDIRRSPNKHVAFGFGVHYCVGAPLARLEGRLALTALLARFPHIELAVPRSELAWRPTTALRGLQALPLRLNGG